MKISPRVAAVAESMTLALSAKAQAMRAEGIDVIGFGAGEPDFNTPQVIRARAIRDIEAGFTKYTPVTGTAELKQAICDKLQRENGLDYATDQIIVSSGGKHSLFNVFQTLLESGDEVIIPAPYWLTYPEVVRLGGGKPVVFATE